MLLRTICLFYLPIQQFNNITLGAPNLTANKLLPVPRGENWIVMSAAAAVMSSNKGLSLCQYMMRQAAATLRAENTEAQPATST